MSDMKYYIQQNAKNTTPVQAGNYKVQFDVVAFFAGQWWGVYATEEPKIKEALDAAIGTQGVMSANKEDYESFSKKKGTRQTHTWSVMEPVLAERPTPQPLNESPVASAETTDPIEEEPGEDRPLEDLLQTKPREEGTSPNYVSSQSTLADHFGMSLPKFREFLSIEGAPAKTEQGHNLPQWEEFMSRNK